MPSPSFQAATILELLVSVTWASVNVSSYMNPHFRVVLPSQAILSGILTAAGLIFCPGFFEVLQSEAPPPTKWFESLSSTIPLHVWGVYILVLRRQGYKPLLYIGSGTAASRGVRARLEQYDRTEHLPHYVNKALIDGCTIVHKSLLLSCPIPGAANIPTFRAALVAVEAALSCIFGAFHNRNKDYGFGDLCLWSRDLFEWDGLCSHSPLLEPVHGDLNLSPEELEAMAAATKEKDRQYQEEYQRNLRANPTEDFKERTRRNNQKQRLALQPIHANRVANKAFYCAVCKVSCRDNASLKRHNESPRHSKKTIMGDNDYHCDVCDISFKYKSNFTQHCTSKSHIARTAAEP